MAGRPERQPAVIVHSLTQALDTAAAAVELDRPVTMLSASGAASAAGVGWWVALTEVVAERHPTARLRLVLDCADQAGVALGALRRGIKVIGYDGPAEVAAKLAAVATAGGAEVVRPDFGQALDLAGETDPATAIRRWLAQR
ncbi:MAG TPA: hypothetical protein VNT30_15365 [Stellaceae bacterium]|nr:hypothetical protein [Stellaceae bacterium]